MDQSGKIHIEREHCTACLVCTKLCPQKCPDQCREEKTTNEGLRICMQDQPFY